MNIKGKFMKDTKKVRKINKIGVKIINSGLTEILTIRSFTTQLC